MEEIFKILGIAIVTAIAAILLRSSKPELSFAVTVTGVIIILLFIVNSMQGVLEIFQRIIGSMHLRKISAQSLTDHLAN